MRNLRITLNWTNPKCFFFFFRLLLLKLNTTLLQKPSWTRRRGKYICSIFSTIKFQLNFGLGINELFILLQKWQQRYQRRCQWKPTVGLLSMLVSIPDHVYFNSIKSNVMMLMWPLSLCGTSRWMVHSRHRFPLSSSQSAQPVWESHLYFSIPWLWTLLHPEEPPLCPLHQPLHPPDQLAQWVPIGTFTS